MIYCATSNPGKLAEYQLAAPGDWQVPGAGPLDCPETGSSFEQNAVEKAQCYARRLQGLVFADDSGLEVEELGGEPGVRSARYAGPQATDEQNRALLLEKLRARGRASRPRARFVCVIALAQGSRLLGTFRGSVDGEILDQARGSGGFGYDSLFYFPPLGRSFAELRAEEKLAHSHRGKAFRAMVEWIKAQAGRLNA